MTKEEKIEHRRAQRRAYYARNREKEQARRRAYRAANPDLIRKQSRTCYQNHREKVLDAERMRYQRMKEAEKHGPVAALLQSWKPVPSCVGNVYE